MLVLIIEDDADLRETICEILESVPGVTSLGFASLEGLAASGSIIDEAELALLDVNLGAGQPSGVDVHAWLRGRGFKGRSLFLTGHARAHPLVEQAFLVQDARVMEKPVPIDTLVGLVRDGG